MGRNRVFETKTAREVVWANPHAVLLQHGEVEFTDPLSVVRVIKWVMVAFTEACDGACSATCTVVALQVHKHVGWDAPGIHGFAAPIAGTCWAAAVTFAFAPTNTPFKIACTACARLGAARASVSARGASLTERCIYRGGRSEQSSEQEKGPSMHSLLVQNLLNLIKWLSRPTNVPKAETKEAFVQNT
jgi:hypothetical protein